METHFNTHYTRDEARELLPVLRRWLSKLTTLRTDLKRQDSLLEEWQNAGADLGGEGINARVRCIADIKELLMEFYRREIQVKDLDRGLIDFPAFIDGKEVFLCWEKGEEDIKFWHELEAGYAGRTRLDD